MLAKKHVSILLAFLVFLIAFLSYSQFFGISFAEFDAVSNILSHSSPDAFEIANIFFQPEQHYHISSIVYRPVKSLIWWAFFQFFALDLVPYHLFGFLLHALNSVLVFFLAKKLLKEKFPFFAFLSALLFALHPVNVHTVAFVSRLPELLVAFFLLSSLLFLSKFLESGKRKFLCLTTVLCFLGVFSKAAGLIIPAALFLFALLFSRERKPFAKLTPSLKLCIPFFAVALAFILLALFSLGSFPGYVNSPSGPNSMPLFYSLKYMLDPSDSLELATASAVLSFLRDPVSDFLLIALFALSSFLIAFYLLAKSKSVSGLFLFALLFIFLASFTAVNFVKWWYVYVPLIPLLILLSALLKKSCTELLKKGLSLKKPFAAAASTFLILVFLNLILASPLLIPYPQFSTAAEATNLYLSQISSAASSLPQNSLVLLFNCPEFLTEKNKDLHYALPLSNEASVQAFLDYKFPEKNLNVFSLQSILLFSHLEKTSFEMKWERNCLFSTENLARENASIYIPGQWKPQDGETDGILLTPNYRGREWITASFLPERAENTYILAFDGKKAQAFPLKEFCK